MVFDIKIYHVAEQELANAVRWYERESSGLGRRFFKEFLKIKETLSRTPSIYQILSSNTRRANLKIFRTL